MAGGLAKGGGMRAQSLLIFLALAAGPAAAQQPRGEMTLFSGPSFNGARFTVTGPRTTLRIPFQVRSVLIARGERWQLCNRTQYRGCVTFDGNARNISRTVASARPAIFQPIEPPGPPVGGGYGASLRGMGAEFFAAPREGGRRVISARNGAPTVAKRSADLFCVNRGWNGAAYQAQETVGRENYLADVLCVRSGY